MPTEQDEVLGYDADHEDPSQYCQHGTWIGSWWGPDYLCHWCELGYSAEEQRAELQHQFERVCRRSLDEAVATYDVVIKIMTEHVVKGTITSTDVWNWIRGVEYDCEFYRAGVFGEAARQFAIATERGFDPWTVGS